MEGSYPSKSCLDVTEAPFGFGSKEGRKEGRKEGKKGGMKKGYMKEGL